MSQQQPQPHPLLVFNHNPKAGGGSILEVLRELKPREIVCVCSPFDAPRLDKKCCQDAAILGETNTDRVSQINNNAIDTSFVHVKEFSQTPASLRGFSFVIGSIREPCSHYLSLWSYGSLGHGSFRKDTVPDPKLYGESPPYFNTSTDVERFRVWMEHKEVSGVVGRRVKNSYGRGVLDGADCWVFVESFRETLLGCLRSFEARGGSVDWTAPTVASLLLQEEEQEQQHGSNNDNNARWMEVSKNNALEDPRSKHHDSCDLFYDDKTAKMVVRQRRELFIYDLFNYEGCCRPGTGYGVNANINAPANTTLGSNANATTVTMTTTAAAETTSGNNYLPSVTTTRTPPSVGVAAAVGSALLVIAIFVVVGSVHRWFRYGRRHRHITTGVVVAAAASTRREPKLQEMQQFIPERAQRE